MAKNNLIYAPTADNFTTTLNGAISSSATTIALNSVTGLQNKAGILVIDRVDTSGNLTPSKQEWIYFTGVSGSSVTLPSAVDGRGCGGSTAQAHSDGAIVEAVFDVTIWNNFLTSYTAQHSDAGTHTAFTTDTLAAGSLASLSASLFVGGNFQAASTASIAGLLNVNNTNMQSGASGYAQQTKMLAAFNFANASNASLSAYEFGGSPTRLGFAQITTGFSTSSASATQVTGLSVSVTIPPLFGRMVKITAFGYVNATAVTSIQMSLWDGTVGSGTQLALAPIAERNTGDNFAITCMAVVTPTAGSKTYNVGLLSSAATTATLNAATTSPAFILVELI